MTKLHLSAEALSDPASKVCMSQMEPVMVEAPAWQQCGGVSHALEVVFLPAPAGYWRRMWGWWWGICSVWTQSVPQSPITVQPPSMVPQLASLVPLCLLLRLGDTALQGGGQVTTSIGATFTLTCQLDTFYEFCSFRWQETENWTVLSLSSYSGAPPATSVTLSGSGELGMWQPPHVMDCTTGQPSQVRNTEDDHVPIMICCCNCRGLWQ